MGLDARVWRARQDALERDLLAGGCIEEFRSLTKAIDEAKRIKRSHGVRQLEADLRALRRKIRTLQRRHERQYEFPGITEYPWDDDIRAAESKSAAA